MNNDGGKKTGKVRAILATVLLVSVAFGVGAFYNGSFTNADKNQSTFVFDGWIYGREDQKKASAALAAAGLNDYSWEGGKLSAPVDKKGEFQSVLANAGAYPKAPSELRVDAVREMSVFESDAKTKMRELNACAMQLERTIEQMRGVEYATVGVRSRREQSGLVMKNVVTASVGVAFLEGRVLDADVLSAITVATKHQLGIDDASNISVIDLKEGKSYLGSEEVGKVAGDMTLLAEKNRIEKYWRDKYLEAFSDVKNLRVSVVADVAYASDAAKSADVKEEKPTALKIDEAQKTESGIATVSYWAPASEAVVSVAPLRTASSVDSVDNSCDANRYASAPTSGRFETLDGEKDSCEAILPAVAEPRYGFAQLGNPGKVRPRNSRRTNDKIVASVEPSSSAGSAVLIGLAEFHWIESAVHKDKTRSAFFEKSLKDGVSDSVFYSSINSVGSDKAPRYLYKPMAAIRQASAVEPLDGGNSGSDAVVLRSILVRIAVPRSYLSAVAGQGSLNSQAPETFADDSDDVVLSEMKRYAVDIFRPTGESLGWNESELERHVVVAAFSDADLTGGITARETNVLPETGVSVTSASDASVEHSSSYVIEQTPSSFMDASDILNSTSASPATSAADDLTSTNEIQSAPGTTDNFSDSTYVPVREPDGKIAEISQTVASDVETVVENPADVAVGFTASLSRLTTKIQNAFFGSENSTLRNLLCGLVAGLVLLTTILWTSYRARRRNRERKAVRKNDVRDTAPKVKDASAANVSRRQGYVSETCQDDYSEYDDLDEFNDELEDELQRIASERGAASESMSGKDSRAKLTLDRQGFSADVPSDEYWNKRREALDLIAQYPERAAASLQKWVKNA